MIKDTPTGCWEWSGAKFTGGYGKFAVAHRTLEGAHRFAWILTNGPIPDGLFVCHVCDNRGCCRPDHLFIGTAKDNHQDMVQKGRARGGHVGAWRTSALKESIVRQIRDRSAGGESHRSIASTVHLDRRTVDRIVARSSHAYVK